MDQKIQELTKTIYNEGVEKGKVEAERIINEAKQKADSLLADAEGRSQQIIADAEKKSADMIKTAESEIQLSGKQALSAVKQQIIDLLMTKILNDNVKEMMLNPDNIASFIKSMLNSWNSGGSVSLEALLPEDQKSQLESAFATSLKKELDSGLSVSFSKEIKGGFRIGPEGGTYKISLSDEDFTVFFKQYLRSRTRKYLFGE